MVASFAASAQTITQQPTNQTVVVGAAATFAVEVSGPGPYSYCWRLNGTNLPAGIITTIAGKFPGGFSGDGGPGTNAQFSGPWGLALAPAGDLFIADENNYRVRKLSATGIITTVAGNGDCCDLRDGGLATNASLSHPEGIALDAVGNLFIADSGNWLIRKVSTNGIISTVAGGGHPITALGDGGPATNALLTDPEAVAVDANGNLLIADRYNQIIRRVDTNGIITTIAGNRSLGFSGDGGQATNAALQNPVALAVDASGNLFIADQSNIRIRKVDTNGIITTVAGNGEPGIYGHGTYSGDGGVATNASLNLPGGLAADAAGNLFIADTENNRVRKVAPDGVITTVAGNGDGNFSNADGVATEVSLPNPKGVAVDAAGNLYMTLGSACLVRKATPPAAPTLTLNGVSTADAGDYSVVITGSGGSVTSSVARLTVVLPPAHLAASRTDLSQVRLTLTGLPNHPYTLQTATNLGAPFFWQSVITNVTDAGGSLSLTLTDTAGAPTRFYRAITQ
jgi:sugar lactone lactonase YvrE